MRRSHLHSLLALSLSFGLLGCSPEMVARPVTGDPNDQASLVSNNTAGFVGNVRVPVELISNNAGGLISNNAGGLISNNAGGYRISALAEQPLANSLVYLLNPDEKFYNDLKGERIVATTDANGAYRLPTVLPTDKQVIVSAMLSGNRRMVGYTFTQQGENRVDVSVASTYVTEFFRAQAKKAGRTMADYPGALDKLPALVAETQKLLDNGTLPIPDLTIGQADAMNKVYLAAFGSRSKALSDGWADLLGRRLVALSTAAGNYALGVLQEPGAATSLGLHLPTGVACDAQGNLFIAEKNHHGIRWVKPDGSSTFIGGFRGDGSVTLPELSPDGVTFAETLLPAVQDVTCDPKGNVIVTLQGGSMPTNVLVFLCRVPGDYYGRTGLLAGHSYLLGDATGKRGHNDGALAGASFNAVAGVTTDDQGNLYLADRLNNLIRRIDVAFGTVSTVAGIKRFTGTTATIADPQGYDTAEQRAQEAIIHRPFDVAWRKGANGLEHLYVWEGTNPNEADPDVQALGNAIREITFDPQQPSEGTIRFLMGGPGKRGFGGDGGLAQDALLNLVDPLVPNVPYGGLAVSQDGRYLYFNDAINCRVRVIDLQTGLVDTAAGGGGKEGDAEAREALLKDVSGLATGPNGEVFFCDSVNHVVRKLNRQFGF
ncbi:NHL repeat protein [compost metagenome]